MNSSNWLTGKRILIGISGGIAAYKALLLIRLFKKAGAEVKVVVTENALEFVTRVSLESLSQNKIYDKVFGPVNDYTTEHIALTDWAEAFVVAPATANIIGKYAGGIADDALSTSLLAFNGPVFLAPAMNGKMYQHFSVERNMRFLAENGVHFIEPAEGFLACGYEGKGRMEEPEVIFNVASDYFAPNKTLLGRKVLVTAGPTYEAIDPVRFIGNHSSGKMGFAIADALNQSGAEVHLVHGPVQIKASSNRIKTYPVMGASQMLEKCLELFPQMDACIMSAAVADFVPANTAPQKIKKLDAGLNLELKPAPDILSHLGNLKKSGQILVGFALETQDEEAYAKGKLQRKNLDFIVLNSLNDPGAGFGTATNKITIIDNKMHIERYPLKPKSEVAHDIVSYLCKFLNV